MIFMLLLMLTQLMLLKIDLINIGLTKNYNTIIVLHLIPEAGNVNKYLILWSWIYRLYIFVQIFICVCFVLSTLIS